MTHLHGCSADIKNYMEKILVYQNNVVYESNICGNSKIFKARVRKTMYILSKFEFHTLVRTHSKRKTFKFLK